MNQENYFELAAFQRNLQVILDNVRNEPLIAHRLTPFGYDDAHVAEGQALLAELEELDQAQARAYGDKEATRNQLKGLFKDANARYGWHRNLAKRLLPKGSNGRRALRLHERKERKRARWLRQAKVFYSNLLVLPEMLVLFDRYGQTEAVLQADLQQVDEVARLDGHLARCKALAEEATRVRNLKWKEAREWLAILLETAREALREEPQLMEAFQMVQPSPSIEELIDGELLEINEVVLNPADTIPTEIHSDSVTPTMNGQP